MDRYLDWAAREHSVRLRVVVLLAQLVFFVGLVPAGILIFGPMFDRMVGLSPVSIGLVGVVLGAGVALVGGVLVGWTVYAQFTLGRGTPAPMLPTQELVTDGPYHYTRNPLVLGGGVYLLGIALVAESPTGVAFAVAFVVIQAVYIREIEERELAERFGDDYLEYKQETPFLIPRP